MHYLSWVNLNSTNGLELTKFPWETGQAKPNGSLFATDLINPKPKTRVSVATKARSWPRGVLAPLGPRTPKASEMLHEHQTLLRALESSDGSPACMHSKRIPNIDAICIFIVWGLRCIQCIPVLYKEQVPANNGLCHPNVRDQWS